LVLSWKKIEEVKFEDDIIKLCIAIEFLHAYSLVHDDLPAMDNDVYRRWELTTWKKYWEISGILVGDLLNSLAFETMWSIKNVKVWIELIKRLWKSVGFYGMIWWQVLDLFFEKNSEEVDFYKLIETHNKKTGALITFSIIWWVILALSENVSKQCYSWAWLENQSKVSNLLDSESFKSLEYFQNGKDAKINSAWHSFYKLNELEKYEKFWKEIWLAFQVKDDLLDVEWTFEETGKSIGGEKKWFIHLIWVEKSKEYLKDLITNCLKSIKDLDDEKLNFLVEYIGNRSR
jgi:geranylgeranyl diphosphate synthase type II